MSVFLDTGFIVALTNKRDSNNKQASATLELIKEGKLGHLFTSTFVFDELVTHILVRQNHSKALEIGQSILDSDITMLGVAPTKFDESWKLFKDKKNLSFTDCTIVKLMEENNIKNLATFDKGFKQFKEINVLM